METAILLLKDALDQQKEQLLKATETKATDQGKEIRKCAIENLQGTINELEDSIVKLQEASGQKNLVLTITVDSEGTKFKRQQSGICVLEEIGLLELYLHNLKIDSQNGV